MLILNVIRFVSVVYLEPLFIVIRWHLFCMFVFIIYILHIYIYIGRRSCENHLLL
ncbi:hypothetical protein Hdeb2414_s0042g00740901 [Helianthus debilis subsp. tardiflorus]